MKTKQKLITKSTAALALLGGGAFLTSTAKAESLWDTVSNAPNKSISNFNLISSDLIKIYDYLKVPHTETARVLLHGTNLNNNSTDAVALRPQSVSSTNLPSQYTSGMVSYDVTRTTTGSYRYILMYNGLTNGNESITMAISISFNNTSLKNAVSSFTGDGHSDVSLPKAELDFTNIPDAYYMIKFYKDGKPVSINSCNLYLRTDMKYVNFIQNQAQRVTSVENYNGYSALTASAHDSYASLAWTGTPGQMTADFDANIIYKHVNQIEFALTSKNVSPSAVNYYGVTATNDEEFSDQLSRELDDAVDSADWQQTVNYKVNYDSHVSGPGSTMRFSQLDLTSQTPVSANIIYRTSDGVEHGRQVNILSPFFFAQKKLPNYLESLFFYLPNSGPLSCKSFNPPSKSNSVCS